MNNELMFLLGIMVAICIVIAIKKMTVSDCEYDERQILIRGKAYKIGFMTMLLFAAGFICASVAYEELIEYGFVWNSISMFAGLTAFAVYSVWNDAYLALKQSVTKNLALCGVVILCNVSWIPELIKGKIDAAELIQSYRAINVFCALTFAVIAFTLIIKMFVDRKEED
ncbi:MAG: hypothetical protein IKU53_02025 [Firmicutes bacterium]|nr:hypothetical protein [Bacillota bacterium]